MRGTPPERILARIIITDTDCWEWPGAINNHGYGVISISVGNLAYVHRLVYEALVGPIPEGKELDHLCENTRCCNPEHLEPKTHLIHMQRNRKSHCRHGHLYTPENTYTRPNGKRHCLTCRREQGREWLRRNYQKPEVKARFTRRTREYRARKKERVS